MSGLGELGNEMKRLRLTLRMRQKDIAEQVGRSTQTISDIERGRTAPSAELVKALDNLLKANGILIRLLREAKVPGDKSVGVSLRGTGHLFYPAVVEGLSISKLSSFADFQRAVRKLTSNYELRIYPHGVAVLHEIHNVEFKHLSDAALWRNSQIKRKDNALAEALENVGITEAKLLSEPYCLAGFTFEELPWTEETIRSRALQILALPRILLGPGNRIDYNREDQLLHSNEPIHDLEWFGTHGGYIGWASWAGAVLFVEDEHIRSIRRLFVESEFMLQAFWAYAAYVQKAENLDSYVHGKDFLKMIRREIFAPRPTEHTTTRLMREALVKTSRLDEILRDAIDSIE